MPRLTVVNPWHWLNEDGSFPDEPRLRKRSIRVAQCIEYGGLLGEEECRTTLLSCAGRGCPGFLLVLKKADGDILAVCDTCSRDEFLIHDWEETPWAIGHQDGIPLNDLAKAHGIPVLDPETLDDDGVDEVLAQVLRAIGSPLSANEVRALIATSDHPGSVLQAVMNSVAGGPDRKDVDRFAPVLMDVWNTTPRDELDGRSPTQMRHAHDSSPLEPAQPINHGRNRPCPCGSGKKYKRCCIASVS
jgi:hypothetical protein